MTVPEFYGTFVTNPRDDSDCFGVFLFLEEIVLGSSRFHDLKMDYIEVSAVCLFFDLVSLLSVCPCYSFFFSLNCINGFRSSC